MSVREQSLKSSTIVVRRPNWQQGYCDTLGLSFQATSQARDRDPLLEHHTIDESLDRPVENSHSQGPGSMTRGELWRWVMALDDGTGGRLERGTGPSSIGIQLL